MPLRTKLQILLTLLAGAASLGWAWHMGGHDWLPFALLALGVLASSWLRIQLFNSDASISLSFPFVLLGLLELRPLEGMLLAALSVAAVTRIRSFSPFSAVQIAFNLSSAIVATACAYGCYFGLHHVGLASAPALALASVAYFLVNTGSVAAVIASSAHQNPIPFWRAQFSWFMPFYVVGAILAATAHWLQASYGWANALLLLPVAYTLYRTYADQVARLQERQQHIEETEALQLRTIEGLAMAIEAKDQNTHDHLFRVRNYVQAVGEAMHLSKIEMQALQTASFLHDIGKLAVPEAIINKPGKLTPEEFEKMKIHPVVGADILERVRFPYPVVPIVRSHHEWWNGTGYPDGLKGEDIPVGARILTVVDCFDALVSDRPYRRGMTSQQALAILRNMSGKQFDPKIVSIFEQYLANLAEADEAVAVGFTPLNTEVEVSRGKAPGAGFESGSDRHEGGKHGIDDADSGNSFVTGPEALSAIAAASQEAHALFEMAQPKNAALRLEEVFAIFASRLALVIPHDVCLVFVKTKDLLLPRFSAGALAHTMDPEPMPLGEGISGWVAQSGKPLLNGNAAAEPGCPTLENGEPALGSTLSIPLYNLQHEIFGVFTLYARATDAFSRDHVRILLSTEAKLSRALEDSSTTLTDTEAIAEDPLTGLPNGRSLFLHLDAELKRCHEAGKALTVAVFDLNDFEEVNQRRGQLAGDRLLAQLAETFGRLRRGDEYFARMGSDEFAFLFPDTDSVAAHDRMAALNAAIGATGRRSIQGLRLSASFATASFPADGNTAERLLAAAGRRMYLNKQSLVGATGMEQAAAPSQSLIACNE